MLRRGLRFVLLLTPTLAMIGVVIWYIAKPIGISPRMGEAITATPGVGKLVVVAVFDQLRGDYLEKWSQHFGNDGFEKLKRDGVWFSNAYLPYAASSTGPGHASIATGVPPSVHGIIENRWFDRASGKVAYAATTDDPIERVPRLPGGKSDKWPGLTAQRMLAPTVGEQLRQHTNGKARVVSLALKDRSAVMMGGKDATGVYCFDSSVSEFHTSSYYRAKLPEWVTKFNASSAIEQWSGRPWDRLKGVELYDQIGPDDMKGEGGRAFLGKTTFPHLLPKVGEKGASYGERLESSAFGNDLLWEFAKAAIEGEQLGDHSQSDLLYVGFSSNDIIGHAFGPDSHEVFDVTLRTDQLLGAMLKYLDARLGKDRFTLIVTADHGICPLPEVSVKKHPSAKRISHGDLLGGLDAALDEAFGMPDGVPGVWVEKDAQPKDVHPWVYLNRRTIDTVGAPYEVVEAYAKNWLAGRADTLVAFSRTQLQKGTFTSELEKTFGPMVQLSFHPDRAGDLYIITSPFILPLGNLSLGTDHGTPHEYDRHVPILVYGNGVPKLGRREEAVSSLSVAAITAHVLGVPKWEKLVGVVPAVLAK
jgi:Type I phosphodiesterase / nucleotide pyrophosphatase